MDAPPIASRSSVVRFSGSTVGELPADQILTSALGRLETAMVFGFDANGALYAASSTGDIGEILYLIERAKALALASVVSVND